jgi:hypothetical protein
MRFGSPEHKNNISPKARQHDPGVLAELIDGRRAALTQIKELTEQARFDDGSA